MPCHAITNTGYDALSEAANKDRKIDYVHVRTNGRLGEPLVFFSNGRLVVLAEENCAPDVTSEVVGESGLGGWASPLAAG
eukprot:CAMPEP_0172387754 /NCGR_PEP_ID=MMETSP1061-20121228/5009_1 /TAXON_ID=37318 /ORGANISM="Pseudo-nitzschia pungens, Strain cf. pungens" /LENGTH=79 /DNA_ID=CAMNT_0013117483 /DNA_START=221 /DNA_END=459 /DNA_ORIENTATION=+